MQKMEDNELIQGLDDLYSNKPIAYIKFCEKEKYSEDICKGFLYANTPNFFREKERKSGIRGQGDKYECLSVLNVENIRMVDPKTGLTMFTAPKGQMTIGIKSDDTVSLVCFYGLRITDLTLLSYDETHATFQIPIELIGKMKEFGEYCAIIQPKELEERISDYCESVNAQYIFNKISYCPQNRIDRINSFNNSTLERFLYKNEDLAYQNEYRLAIDIMCPEDHYIRIGKLQNAISLKAENLERFEIEINFKTEINGA